jgi:hypothetical protein
MHVQSNIPQGFVRKDKLISDKFVFYYVRGARTCLLFDGKIPCKICASWLFSYGGISLVAWIFYSATKIWNPVLVVLARPSSSIGAISLTRRSGDRLREDISRFPCGKRSLAPSQFSEEVQLDETKR